MGTPESDPSYRSLHDADFATRLDRSRDIEDVLELVDAINEAKYHEETEEAPSGWYIPKPAKSEVPPPPPNYYPPLYGYWREGTE